MRPTRGKRPSGKRMFGYMNSINITLVMEDTRALPLCRGQSLEHSDCRHGRLFMSGRYYASNAADEFSGKRQGDASIYGTHLASPNKSTVRIWPKEEKAGTLFGARDRYLRADGDHRESDNRELKERTPTRGRSSTGTITVLRLRSGPGLPPRRQPSGIGNGFWR